MVGEREKQKRLIQKNQKSIQVAPFSYDANEIPFLFVK